MGAFVCICGSDRIVVDRGSTSTSLRTLSSPHGIPPHLTAPLVFSDDAFLCCCWSCVRDLCSFSTTMDDDVVDVLSRCIDVEARGYPCALLGLMLWLLGGWVLILGLVAHPSPFVVRVGGGERHGCEGSKSIVLGISTISCAWTLMWAGTLVWFWEQRLFGELVCNRADETWGAMGRGEKYKNTENK